MNKKTIIGIIVLIILAMPAVIAEDTTTGCCLNNMNLGELYCKGTDTAENRVGPEQCCGSTQSCDLWKSTSCINTPECSAPLIFGCCCIGSGGIPSNKDACEGNGYSFSSDPEHASQDSCQTFCQTTAVAASCESDYWSISLTPVKGEAKIQVKVAGCTPMAPYSVKRYDADGSSNEETIISNSQSTGTFTDDNVDWGMTYTYKVISGEEKVRGQASPGDFECAGYESDEKFCIPSEYYIREQEFSNYNYFIQKLKDDTYANAVIARMEEKKFDNMPVKCDAQNKLTIAGPSCGGGACAINKKDNTLTCINETRCQNLTTTNIFGMSFTNTTCETNVSNNIPKYCFYDKSETTVDYCYDCKPQMSCADYKSEYACGKDNCHLNRCEWNTTNPTMNTGVCVAVNSGQNCKWCTELGTESMQNKNVFNKVFDSCSVEKATALSTSYGYCIYNLGSSQSCSQTVCADYGYNRELCTGSSHTVPIKNEYFELTSKSQDPCNIGVCEFHDLTLPSSNVNLQDWGGCRKNADVDSANTPDCPLLESGGRACEEDYFTPYTEIIPTKYYKGCPIQFQIRIRDKINYNENAQTKNDTRYKTYFCIGPSCTQPNGGSEFSIFTNRTLIKVNGITNFTDDSGKSLLSNVGSTLKEGEIDGENLVWYYTKDPSGNLEVKKNFTFYSSENCAYLTYSAIIK